MASAVLPPLNRAHPLIIEMTLNPLRNISWQVWTLVGNLKEKFKFKCYLSSVNYIAFK